MNIESEMFRIETIDPVTLQDWLNNNRAILIDVREEFEYREAHIDKAINIPLSILPDGINEIQELKTKKVVLCCKAGVRSMQGCRMLINSGFKGNLWNLAGGLQVWQNKYILS